MDRFHLLSEFDNGKRSCRKRLADHNRRRRKSQQQPNLEIQKPPSQGGGNTFIDGLSSKFSPTLRKQKFISCLCLVDWISIES